MTVNRKLGDQDLWINAVAGAARAHAERLRTAIERAVRSRGSVYDVVGSPPPSNLWRIYSPIRRRTRL